MMFNPFIKDGYSGRMPLRLCPVCAYTLDGITSMTGKSKPVPGDFSVCINCRSVLRIVEGGGFEKSSLLEVPVSARYAFAKILRVMESMPPLKRKE